MKTLADLNAIRERMKNQINNRESVAENDTRVVVGMATCGISAGARPVLNTLVEEVAKRNLKEVQVVQTGCIGMCTYEPIVEVFAPNKDKVTYIHVDVEKAKRIVAEHIVNGSVVGEYTIGAIE